MTVGRRDLARVVAEVRALLKAYGPTLFSRWRHMDDWDRSFERLADALEAADGYRDDALRCEHAEPYAWPEERGPRALYRVRRGVDFAGYATRTRMVHIGMPEDEDGIFEGLCGLHFTSDDAVRLDKGEATCPVCLREERLRQPRKESR